jgi:cytochrome P450
MTLNSNIQAKAHAELDRVVGKYILPTFADEVSLPYIGAIVKEVLRCGISFSS